MSKIWAFIVIIFISYSVILPYVRRGVFIVFVLNYNLIQIDFYNVSSSLHH